MRSTLLFLSILAAAILAVPSTQAVVGTPVAELDGAQEVPPNASPGTGFFTIQLDDDSGMACWHLEYTGLVASAHAAHVHKAFAGSAGPIVITLPGVSGTSGVFDGCQLIDPTLADAIIDSPLSYYVNVHTPTYPGGEIRGQLHRPAPGAVDPVPELSTILLVGLGAAVVGIAGTVVVRRK